MLAIVTEGESIEDAGGRCVISQRAVLEQIGRETSSALVREVLISFACRPRSGSKPKVQPYARVEERGKAKPANNGSGTLQWQSKRTTSTHLH